MPIRVSLSIPATLLDKSEIRAKRLRAIDELKKLIAQMGRDPDSYDYIDLAPSDLGFTNDVAEQPLSTANDYNTTVDMKVPEDRFIAIYGVANLATKPLTTKIRFWKGTVPVKEYYIEDMYLRDEPEKFFDEVLAWKEGEILKIEQYAKATGTDKIVFYGIKAVPKGEIIGGK